MKYFLLVFALISSIIISTVDPNNELEWLDDMYQLAKEQDLNLVNWQITIRETISIQDIDSFIEKQTGKDFYISEKDNGKIHFNRQKKYGLSETLLLVHTNDGNSYQVLYSISADEYHNKIKKMADNYIKTVEKDIFSVNAQKFSCIFTNFDGIINFDVLKNIAKNRLNLQTINETREDKLWTWTAHNPNWDNYLNTTNQEQINMQIALKHTENKQSNVIIGTPILISEY